MDTADGMLLDRTPPEPLRPERPAPDRTLVAVTALLSAGAGLVHLGVTPSHFDHHWSMGVAFLLAGWAQLGWAVALWTRFSRSLLAVGLGLQAACLGGLLAVSTVGWPFGPQAWEAEAVTTAALLCVGLEVAAVASAGALLLGGISVPRFALPLAMAMVVGASSAALAVDADHSAGAGDHHGATAAGAATTVAQGASDGHGTPGHHDPAAAGAKPAGTGTDSTAASAAAGGHAHGPVDTTPPTPEQKAAADKLLQESRATLKKYALLSVAEAEGYKVTHDAGGVLFHYGHPGYRNDGRTLDPKKIESLLYVTLPGGGKLLVGGMYMMPLGEKGPNIGGSLTQWHGHDDLCLDPVKGMAISQLPGGGCPPGSAIGPTGEMMHVWSIEYPGGPFAELDAAALREAVLDVYGMGKQPA